MQQEASSSGSDFYKGFLRPVVRAEEGALCLGALAAPLETWLQLLALTTAYYIDALF